MCSPFNHHSWPMGVNACQNTQLMGENIMWAGPGIPLLISGVFTRILWFSLVLVSSITHTQAKEEAAMVWQTADKEAWSEAFGQEEPGRKLWGAKGCGQHVGKRFKITTKFCSPPLWSFCLRCFLSLQLQAFSGFTAFQNICGGGEGQV